jgi:uncharacterized membrane protein YidH (DUF202 family)
LRSAFLVLGIALCLLGGGVILYQLSESCEDSAFAGASQFYPWCSDVLDHVNFTFVGVLVLFVGVVVLALGGSLHWMVEPSKGEENR